MKERPILFNGEMVRAILDGRKTQTRRVIKPQPKLIESSGRWYWEKALDVNGRPLVDASRRWWEYYGTSPYGKPGDRLWVRETWRQCVHNGSECVRYRADDAVLPKWPNGYDKGYGGKWRPSIHMPRWASRILLEITDVRVQRLQDISDKQILAEGVRVPMTEGGSGALRLTGKYPPSDYFDGSKIDDPTNWLRAHFASLWDFINPKNPWDSNPWVWAVTFKRVDHD